MHENINKATDSVRSSVLQLRSKLNHLRTSLEDLALEVERIDNKFDKLDHESEMHRLRLVRTYERRLKLNEKEIRDSFLKDYFDSLKYSEEDQVTTASVDKVANTASIMECFVNLISNGNEGFELMSRSVIFPCVYEKLLNSESGTYFLERVPEDASLMVDLGRDFVEKVSSKTNLYLSTESAWNQLSGEVQEWWKTEVLPFIYEHKEVDFSDPAWSFSKMQDWREDRGTRETDFPSMYDVFYSLRTHREEVASVNGVNALEVEVRLGSQR